MAKGSSAIRERISRKRKAPTVNVPPVNSAPCDAKGTLVIIGGNECKEGHRPILDDVARRAGSGKLLVATLASEEPEEQWEEYSRVFKGLGVKKVEQLDARRREDLVGDDLVRRLDGVSVVFFAGGDQMKITSKFGGTPLCARMRDLYQNGATIAGTSSGASVMSDVMLVAGEGGESQEVDGSLRLAPGLGLLPGIIIDQHFAQRGRIGRLIAAVAQNPRCLGVGIDEDTGLIFEAAAKFRILGSGAVYVVDGTAITFTNAAQEQQGKLSAHGMIIHLLGEQDTFDLTTRTPLNTPPKKRKREPAPAQ
jgi:cyanophycinase